MNNFYIKKLLKYFVLLCFAHFSYCNNEEDTLQLVHVIFRHGDRTPSNHYYKNDPHQNDSYFPLNLGELTETGKLREFKLGKLLHKRYKHLLSNFSNSIVDARSTNYHRTKQSLLIVLTSLFSPDSRNLETDTEFSWPVIPYNYSEAENDHLLGDPYENCPAIVAEYERYFKYDEGHLIQMLHSQNLSHLSDIAGQDLNIRTAADLYFLLTMEKENGKKVPAWFDSYYPEYLHEMVIIDYNTTTATQLQKKLASGFLLKKIVTDSLKVAAGKQTLPKIYLYSGHEYNIAYLLRLLDLFNAEIPPYGSYLAIELHNIKEKYVFKIYYEDYFHEKPTLLEIPACGTSCTLKEFIKLYSAYFPSSEYACNTH